MISYEDFSKTELKVAKILSAERVEGSPKLLKLQIDLGVEKRQLVAGVGKKYAPEELVGKNIVVVANLEPRILVGLESQGMLLAASNETEGPVILTIAGDIAPGSEVR